LKEQIDDDDFSILRKKKITGQDFLDMTEEKFEKCGLEMGPAMRLVKEVKTLKEKPKRAFSSYKSLSEVLAKYDIDSDSRTDIPQLSQVRSYLCKALDDFFATEMPA